MGHTCESVATWLWSLSINWDAWSAIGTIGAIAIALILPIKMAKREWARQDQIRLADQNSTKQLIAGYQQEVCSVVDRILADRDAAIAIFDSQPVYYVGIQAIKRININARILLNMTELLEKRPSLSDGSLFSAVAAKRIAETITEETGSVLKHFGTVDPGWPQRIAALSNLEELASITKLRSDGVREYYGLVESQRAAEIRAKYIPLAEAIRQCKIADSGEPDNNLHLSYS